MLSLIPSEIFNVKTAGKSSLIAIRIVASFLFVFSHSIFAKDLSGIYKEVIVQDFETDSFGEENIKAKLGPELNPEVRISTVFRTPERDSEKSLYVEVSAERNQSFQILFKKPWTSQEFVKEFSFHMYANEGGGSLFLLVRDSTLDMKKLLLTHFNFSGWKKVSLDISRKVRQDDLVTHKNSELVLLGFLYVAPFEMKRGAREVFVIDDILAKVRPKYLLFPGEKTLVK
ncbi:flagellar assembly protein FlaA [Leptospira wolffii]|uniref:Flagellar assembly protein FlaA n=1 Tax=Leptospira wolffii TaxID=409998 RepID=A0A2M9Z7A1_9LEPT|nr:flagellar assembly protein FlaA [Leptospira wolffii]PJZ64311.1 flagellar assembly protein FlaA [Leptospira wolffii]